MTDQTPPAGTSADSSWAEERRRAAQERSRLLSARQDAEHAKAAHIVTAFLEVARREGLESVPLRVQGYRGGEAKTPLTGWYLRADRTVAIDTEGRFYVLKSSLTWMERLRGVTPTAQPVPLTIGEGGRDGDIIPLRYALNLLLPGWEERSTTPLT